MLFMLGASLRESRPVFLYSNAQWPKISLCKHSWCLYHKLRVENELLICLTDMKSPKLVYVWLHWKMKAMCFVSNMFVITPPFRSSAQHHTSFQWGRFCEIVDITGNWLWNKAQVSANDETSPPPHLGAARPLTNLPPPPSLSNLPERASDTKTDKQWSLARRQAALETTS